MHFYKPISNTDEVAPHHAVDVVHLMQDSAIRYINAEIYTINDLQNKPELFELNVG